MTPEAVWYRGHPLSYLLLPLSWLFCALVGIRRLAFRRGWIERHRLPVPVIIVGNLTVGGTGKTPLVLWLADFLRRAGRRPGILTRGYGRRAGTEPRLVSAASDPFELGDEPVLLARRSGCPVAAGPDRVAAGWMLVGDKGCDMIVADDGLQHYRLQRDLEILVVDGARGLGNGRCLPAGPLREPPARQHEADFVVTNGGSQPGGSGMRLRPGRAVSLRDPGVTRDLADFRGQPTTAVAGIGNPERFFAMLRNLGLQIDGRPYPDHHRFSSSDVASWPVGAVLMTEKDAVKCEGFARADHWHVPVEAELDEGLVKRLSKRLKGIGNG